MHNHCDLLTEEGLKACGLAHTLCMFTVYTTNTLTSQLTYHWKHALIFISTVINEHLFHQTTYIKSFLNKIAQPHKITTRSVKYFNESVERKVI